MNNVAARVLSYYGFMFPKMKEQYDARIKEIEEGTVQITESEIQAFLDSLKNVIGDRKYEITCLYFGFLGDDPKKASELAAEYDVTSTRIVQVLINACNAYKRSDDFIDLFGIVQETYDTPEKMPVYRIRGISARTNNCLQKAGICDVSDILKKEPKSWFRVENLGEKGREELVAAMKSMGYGDFSI